MPAVKVRIEKTQTDQSGVGKSSATGTKDSSATKTAALSLFAHKMVATAKQTVNYAVNNIGNFTGDFVLQDRIQEVVDGVSELATIGVAFATNPVAGAVAVAGLGIKTTLKAVTDYRNDVIAERDRSYLLARSGNATKNGSRGTEN